MFATEFLTAVCELGRVRPKGFTRMGLGQLPRLMPHRGELYTETVEPVRHVGKTVLTLTSHNYIFPCVFLALSELS